MTSKNPARSCEDVDESVLSYAEIKALCIGDPRIKEKMDLDIQVSKLRMLEGEHRSQQYRLQDDVLKHYPQRIEQTQKQITGLEEDFKRWIERPQLQDTDDGFEMTIMGKIFGKGKRGKAGEAILEIEASLHGAKNASKIGEYKGFEMILTHSFVSQKMSMTLENPESGVTHWVELGTSPVGNIARIDNVLAKIPERLESEKTYMKNLHKQLETAKEELDRPFPQAKELEEKSARLAELDILLNMDNKQPSEQEEQETQIAFMEELIVTGETKKSHLESMKDMLVQNCPDEQHSLREKARKIMADLWELPDDSPIDGQEAFKMLELVKQNLDPQAEQHEKEAISR
jgi:hypothetical protein